MLVRICLTILLGLLSIPVVAAAPESPYLRVGVPTSPITVYAGPRTAVTLYARPVGFTATGGVTWKQVPDRINHLSHEGGRPRLSGAGHHNGRHPAGQGRLRIPGHRRHPRIGHLHREDLGAGLGRPHGAQPRQNPGHRPRHRPAPLRAPLLAHYRPPSSTPASSSPTPTGPRCTRAARAAWSPAGASPPSASGSKTPSTTPRIPPASSPPPWTPGRRPA